MMDTDVTALVKRLTRELDNFRDIAKYILPTPGEVPRLKGIDVFGGSLPLERLGGRRPHHLRRLQAALRSRCPDRARARADGRPDVVAELERCRRKAGIAVVDVAGHRMTDALLAAMLHQAFLLGAHLRARHLRPHHAAAVREPEHALLPVVGRAQVRLDDLRRDRRGRHVPVPVGGHALPRGLLARARSLHGRGSRAVRLVPAARHAAVVGRDRSQHDDERCSASRTTTR